MSRQSEDRETKRALVHGATAVAVLAACALITYAIPVGAEMGGVELDRLKPWVAGDSLPIVRVFEKAGEEEVPAFAGHGGSYRTGSRPSRASARRLGAAVAANIGDQSQRGAHGRSRDRRRGHDDDASPAVRIDPGEYDGIVVEIADVEALQPFYRALEETARRDPGAITRIGHYGDSSIATDLITHTMRRRFQDRFGDAGHGFHLIARGTMPYTHRDVAHRASSEWELRQLVMSQDRDGLYGYGGVAYRARSGAYASFATDDRGPVGGAVSRFEIWYRREPAAGRIRYRIDGGPPQYLETNGEEAEDAVEVLDVEDGPHQLDLRPGGGGNVRLYGVVMERDGPGVVYDSIGLVGARARRLLNYDTDHLRAQMERRDLDLLVLGFGGNEADDPVRRMPRYESEFRRVIRRMRAGRAEMACLVFAPLDQAHRDQYGRIATMPTVPLIVEAQKNAAHAEGCAFFNTFEAMGGEGAMGEWARSRPRLALTDYRHATPAGYEVIANMFYKALLKGFADYLGHR